MITILMAHYNLQAYAKVALKSVLKQKNPNWKLLICDDCSDEENYKYLESLIKDPRIKLIRNGKNLGYIGTLKRMIDEADTEIVGILDPDDAIASNAVELVLEAYKNHPNIGFTYSNVYICDSQLVPRNTKEVEQISKTVYSLEKHTIDHFRTFKKSMYYKSGGYDEKYIYAEDQDISYKFEEAAEGFHIDKALYYYRVLPLSQSHDPIKRQRGILSHVQAILAAVKRRESTDIPSLNYQELQEKIRKLRFSKPNALASSTQSPLVHIFHLLKHHLSKLVAIVLEKIFPKRFKKIIVTLKDYFLFIRDIKDLFKLKDSHRETISKLKVTPIISACAVCQSKKFAFLIIEKNASSYLLSLLIELDWNYPRESSRTMAHNLTGYKIDGELRIAISQMKDLDPQFIKFAVYRDPVTRALSFYKEKIINNRDQRCIRMIAERTPGFKGSEFERYIEFLKNSSSSFALGYTDPHVVPQYLFFKDSCIDYLVPMQELDLFLEEKRGLQSAPGQNISGQQDQSFRESEGITEEHIDIIKEIYQEDYNLPDIYKDKLYQPEVKIKVT